ncbi:PP0621 family protein [Isoalcanivorax beigongshangi]|uniref:PP0621 family protein n=1 Tax=Isoalcanivorax beigongshangi TaxID=3238810 RepID=A0ABV4AJT8_9GAMM
MGLFRLLLLALLAWVIWRLFRHYQQRKATPPAAAPGHTDTMVRCALCDVHVPSRDALRHQGHHFCSPLHQQRWLERIDD